MATRITRTATTDATVILGQCSREDDRMMFPRRGSMSQETVSKVIAEAMAAIFGARDEKHVVEPNDGNEKGFLIERHRRVVCAGFIGLRNVVVLERL